MSDSGVPVEEIARLAGHTGSRTTEVVYLHKTGSSELRRVPQVGSRLSNSIILSPQVLAGI